MRRLKILKEFIRLKTKKVCKMDRMLYYATKGLITFDDFNKYYDKKVKKGGKHAK